VKTPNAKAIMANLHQFNFIFSFFKVYNEYVIATLKFRPGMG